MGNRLSKIVTRTGDDGSTGLADGSRRRKNDIRIHCLGEVDELNASIGVLISSIEKTELRDMLLRIQHDLFDLGAELSQPGKCLLNAEYLTYLEQNIEQMNARLPQLKEFILPGGSTLISQVHLTRTLCRRVERRFVALQQQEAMNAVSLSYINRLSDLFFILARYIGQLSGQAEIYWQSQYARSTGDS